MTSPPDIKQLTQLLYNTVQVKTERGTVLEGGLLAIDPVSNTAVLLLSQSASSVASAELLLVPALDWSQVVVLPTDESTLAHLKSLVDFQSSSATTEAAIADLAPRRAQLIENFTRHGLKAVEQGGGGGNLVVQGCVTVRPPYRPEDCRATNEIVLDRVLTLMKSFS